MKAAAKKTGASKRKAAEAKLAEAPVRGTLFAGCSFVFWQRDCLQLMMQRVEEFGGKIDKALSASTTHVVCRPEMPAGQVAERLRNCPPSRKRTKVEVRGGVVVHWPMGLSIITPEFVAQSILRKARQPEADYLPSTLLPPPARRAAVDVRPAATALHEEPGGQQQQLARHLQPAEPACSGGSSATVPFTAGELGEIMRGAEVVLQQAQEAQQAQQAQQGDDWEASTATVPFTPQELARVMEGADIVQYDGGRGGAAALQPVGSGVEQGRAGSTGRGGRGATAPAGPEELLPQWQAQVEREEEGQEPWGGVCVVQRLGPEILCVRGAKPRFTGGHTGIPWGSYGVWREPVDEAAARDTVEKVRSAWYKATRTALPLELMAPGAGAGTGGVTAGGVTGAGGGGGSGVHGGSGGNETNGICPHIACSRRLYCLAKKLNEMKEVYEEKKDHFRIKALDRAVMLVVKHIKPLDTDEDVDEIAELGPKSSAKVKEILRHGSSLRLEVARKDPQKELMALFLNVWGAGHDTAQRWYHSGCRSIDDVLKRGDLTVQQQVGCKYYDDIMLKIPRAEIAEAEAIAREAIFDLVEAWGAHDVERTFAQACGSYCRGKPESSDIDILVCLPPSLDTADCGLFLTQLLGRLLDVGLLVDEMNARLPHDPDQGKASWMGICKVPGHAHFRRIDVKVYAHRLTPFAVNYFCNSMSFCRACRHWANTHAAPLAQKFHKAATSFKLSDAALVPRTKGGCGPDRSEVLLGPEIECTCETQIFEHLGLAYVPPTMRLFHNWV